MRIDLAQRLAAAAAVQDPSLMLRQRAAQAPAPARGPRRRRDLGPPLIALAAGRRGPRLPADAARGR